MADKYIIVKKSDGVIWQAPLTECQGMVIDSGALLLYAKPIGHKDNTIVRVFCPGLLG
jgi:hypothetical protein